MDVEVYLIFFVITILINIIFIISLTCFGYIFIFFIKDKTKESWNLSRLEYCFISFAIGLSIYLAWSYIVDTMQIFNFYTIYLPILLFDLVFIIFIIFKHFKFNIFIKNFKNFLKQNKYGIAALIIASLLLLVKIWNALFLRTSLLSRDPYFWTSNVLYLLDHSHLNYEWTYQASYPKGFVFYGAGNLLISMDKTIGYFFMKFGGFSTFCLYLIMMYIISRRFFKKKYITYICLILVVSYNYIIYRTLVFLPSNIVNLLMLISILIIFTNTPNYLLGFIIPAAYLLHSLSAIFLIISIFCLYLVKFAKDRKNVKILTKEIITIMTLSFLLIIPFLINIYITRNRTIFYLIEGYIEAFTPESIYVVSVNKNLILLFMPYFRLNFEAFISFLFYNTIGIFIFLSIGGLFFEYKKRNGKFIDGYFYLKISVILILIVSSLPYILFLNDGFLDWVSERAIETFFPQLILLSCLFLEWIIEVVIKIFQKSKIQYKKLSIIIEKNKHSLNYLNLKRLFIFSLVMIPFSVYINSTDKKFEYYYLYSTDLIENILYINENVPVNENIAVLDLYYDNIGYTKNGPYRLLYNYNLNYYRETINYTYNGFYNFSYENGIGYVILKKSLFDEINFLEDFENSPNFIEIYPKTSGNIYRLYRVHYDQ